MTISISIPESILTAYLRAGIANLPGGALTGNRSGFVIVETARIASLPDHAIHPDVGIVLRDRGAVSYTHLTLPTICSV